MPRIRRMMSAIPDVPQDSPFQPGGGLRKLQILLVDDSADIRLILRERIAKFAGLEVCGEGTSTATAIAHIQSLAPDVVILDIQLDNSNGLDVLQYVSVHAAQIKVIVFSNYSQAVFRRQFLSAGAYQFYDKTSEVDLMYAALEYLSRTTQVRAVTGTFAPSQPNSAPLAPPSRKDQLLAALDADRWTDQLQLYYQPIVSLGTGTLQEFEALLRWTHPTLGSVEPDEFIPLAEATGAIRKAGAWVLRTACEQLGRWQRAGNPQLRMSFNVSPIELQDPDFVTRTKRIIAEHGIHPDNLTMEVTESIFIEDTAQLVRVTEQIRKLGIRLVLDDFGTAYASLRLLGSMPFDHLKIDRSFMADITHPDDKAVFVRAILDMANGLGLAAVAEGIESSAQAEWLTKNGCQYGQGYFLGHPLPADAIERDWLQRGAIIPNNRRISAPHI